MPNMVPLRAVRRYRVQLLTAMYTEIVRRLDRHANRQGGGNGG
jgi:hypothetical protein